MFGSSVILRAALPYLVAVAAVFGALFGAYSFGVSVEHQARVAEVATLQGRHEQDMHILDKAHTDALAVEYRRRADAEAMHAADMAALDAKYTKEISDAKKITDSDIAAVRSGAWRVRDQFTCAGTGGTSGAAGQTGTGTGLGDAAAKRGLGQADAAAIIADADEGDGWAGQLKACQDIVRRDRQGQR